MANSLGVNVKAVVHKHDDLHFPEELKEYLASRPGITPSDRLFVMNKYILRWELQRGTKLAGLEPITVHCFRHSHISLLMNYVNCASVMDIAKRAGHKTPDITMIYFHRYSNKDEIIAEQLNGMMTGCGANVGKE